MNSLPKEIWVEISLYLSPDHLLLVNKSFSNLYDNHWCKTYLEFTYPNIDFTKRNDYKNLTMKSTKQGHIWVTKKKNTLNLQLQGIKACSYYRYHVILDFMGNLYILDGNKIIQLDEGVVDISREFYIKDHELRRIEIIIPTGEIITTSIMTYSDNIMLLRYCSAGLYISTYIDGKSTIFLYNGVQFVQEKSFPNKIKEICSEISSKLVILFYNGTMIECTPTLELIKTYNYTCEDMKPGVLKVDGCYYLSGVSIYDKTSLKQYPEHLGNYVASVETLNKDFLLTDKALFIRNPHDVYIRLYANSHIKAIFGHFGRDELYEICEISMIDRGQYF
jgi:hypothetical protein